jgi:hypothetical protein
LTFSAFAFITFGHRDHNEHFYFHDAKVLCRAIQNVQFTSKYAIGLKIVLATTSFRFEKWVQADIVGNGMVERRESAMGAKVVGNY